MASSSSKAFLFALLVFAFALILVSGFQFDIGEKSGWKIPTGKESETYNEWAAQNRFRIGDTLYFKYTNDSVLIVTPADYLNCKTTNPILKFEDGNTVFKFERSGFFYFISGLADHCKSGQKIIIRVMHPSEGHAPGLAPEMAPGVSPSGGGGSSGGGGEPGPYHSSALKIGVASSFVVTVVVSVCFAFYMFM